jgi:GNAT superfamily N-acetyltransferase
MTSSIEVKRASSSDFPECLPLLSELHRGDIGETIAGCFAEFCSMPNAVALVALQGDEVVGLIAGTEAPDLDFEAHVATVNAIIVSERCRRRGIGHGLMENFVRWAQERGCAAALETTGREDAKRFLGAVGFEPRAASVGFVKHLVPPSRLGKPRGVEA